MERYRRFLLTRLSVSPDLTEYIENCNSCFDDEAVKHTFHKIMIHNWTDPAESLFEQLSNFLNISFIPIKYTVFGTVTSFYTDNLNIIMRLIRSDFMAPFQRSMYSIDVLFNDKTSMEMFGAFRTIEDIISQVVSRRFDENCELDLSDFCNDAEFVAKGIHFYKLSLLANFKILMLRMGRDAKSLNLSNNNLINTPTDILNFFIKGELTAVNYSNNQIPSLAEFRLPSKLESIWLEGNPLCEEEDAMSYVKQVATKLPRLKMLDGIPVNQHGVLYPFWRNYLGADEPRARMLVEKFLMLYFTHWDHARRRLDGFYHRLACISIANNNMEDTEKDPGTGKKRRKVVHGRVKGAIKQFLVTTFPRSWHDPSSFTVDVLKHDRNCLLIVVDGLLRNEVIMQPGVKQEVTYQFRRTFLLQNAKEKSIGNSSTYVITNEVITFMNAAPELLVNSFKRSISNITDMALIDPTKEDIEKLTAVFSHITNLKKSEAEVRLQVHKWDIKQALNGFVLAVNNNKIPLDQFNDEDNVSDWSSIDNFEID